VSRPILYTLSIVGWFYSGVLTDGKSSLDALNEALDNVEQMTETILEQYTASLTNGDFVKYEEPTYDYESVNERMWAEKEKEGKGSWEEFQAERKRKEEEEEKEKEKSKPKAKGIKAGR